MWSAERKPIQFAFFSNMTSLLSRVKYNELFYMVSAISGEYFCSYNDKKQDELNKGKNITGACVIDHLSQVQQCVVFIKLQVFFHTYCKKARSSDDHMFYCFISKKHHIQVNYGAKTNKKVFLLFVLTVYWIVQFWSSYSLFILDCYVI